MNAKPGIILAVGLGVIALTWGGLMVWKQKQHLGKPGIRVGAMEVRDEKGSLLNTNGVILPVSVKKFISEALPFTRQEFEALPKDTTFGRRIYKGQRGEEILLTTVLMGTDRTSIHRPQYCLTGQGWLITKTESDELSIPLTKETIPVLKLTTTRLMEVNGVSTKISGLYVYWFVADGKVTNNDRARMLTSVSSLLRTGTMDRWAYVSCFGVCPPGQEQELWLRLRDFLVDALPQFQEPNAVPVGRQLTGDRAR